MHPQSIGWIPTLLALVTLLGAACSSDSNTVGGDTAGDTSDGGGDTSDGGADGLDDGDGGSDSDAVTDADNDGGETAVLPDFAAATFTSPTTIDNPYFALVPFTTAVFLAEADGEFETIVVEVLDETRDVAGVATRVVRDRVFTEGLLIEDTHDWYAQDDEGNVWYMGETVDNYEYDDNDEVLSIDNEGSWETGEDVSDVGAVAQPGYQMLASPSPGDRYYQEFYVGEAEDLAEVVALDAEVELSDGSSFTTLQTLDVNPFTPGADEYKYYASGVGMVLEEAVAGGETVELRGLFLTGPDSIPDFASATFTDPTTIDSPFHPLVPGSTRTYEVETEDGTERVVVEVLAETREVAGVTSVVVRDRVTLDDVLIEDTHDWFAQDDDDNVWYMGEEVDDYNYDDEGTLIDITHGGAWEAGEDVAELGSDAVAGVLVFAAPQVGASHRQEYYAGEAEDMVFVVATDVTVTLGDATVYENCLQTLEWSPLGPDALEYKFYAPGVGVVREIGLGTDEVLDLIELTTPE